MHTVYQCDHCAFAHSLKGMVLHHEDHCVKNPEVKTCFTCKHHSKVLECSDHVEYKCDVDVSAHTRMNCEDGVVNCNEYQDKR